MQSGTEEKSQKTKDEREEEREIVEKSEEDLWEEVGFHRQLAGFWYNIVFSLLHIVIGATVGVVLYPIMYPFPETLGYYDSATAVFVAIFVAFDLGTSNMMNRFVGANINNPTKLVQYLQYFI